jgi:uncharacterized protein
LVAKYGRVYTTAAIPKVVYHTPEELETIVVPTMLIVSPDMPDDIAYKLTKLLFAHRAELAKVHPEGGNVDRANGSKTDPVPLHPGAYRYFMNG